MTMHTYIYDCCTKQLFSHSCRYQQLAFQCRANYIRMVITKLKTRYTVLLEYFADEKPLQMSQMSQKIDLLHSGKDCVYLHVLLVIQVLRFYYCLDLFQQLSWSIISHSFAPDSPCMQYKCSMKMFRVQVLPPRYQHPRYFHRIMHAQAGMRQCVCVYTYVCMCRLLQLLKNQQVRVSIGFVLKLCLVLLTWNVFRRVHACVAMECCYSSYLVVSSALERQLLVAAMQQP